MFKTIAITIASLTHIYKNVIKQLTRDINCK